MTGPIIPADQWPEWADRHCWDKNGDGWFYGLATPSALKWWPELRRSNIPMPVGHDWRVPVMRLSEKSPAADPEDVRIVRIIAEKIDEGRLDHPGFYKNGRLSAALRNLLTLIDGQAGGQSHPDTDRFNFIEGECLAVEAVSVRASEDDADAAWVISQHHMGRGQVVLHRSHDDNLRRAIDAVMQPAKGEGE